MDIDKLSTDEIISLYPKILKELKSRNVITTNNLIGELGEYLAIENYNKIANLPTLQKATASTQNIDAISNKGERYSIKSASGTATGVFHSLSGEKDFEFLIIVIFDKDYQLINILEYSWEEFLNIRKIKKPENKFNIPLTKKVLEIGKVII
tara:strand:+ start:117 stop:572 length:456 start_codon:yes stop_codon:yes gene_type:complete